MISCGPRSGVSHDVVDIPVCGVTVEIEPATPQTVSEVNGHKLFKSFCSECHMLDKNLKCGNLLQGVMDRIPQGKWFKYFILNSDSVKKSMDAYSRKIDHDYQTDYEHKFKLTDQEVEDISNYLRLWR